MAFTQMLYKNIVNDVLDDFSDKIYNAAIVATNSMAVNLDKVANALDDSRGGQNAQGQNTDDADGDLIMSKPTFDSVEMCRAQNAQLYTAMWKLCKRLMLLPETDRKTAVRLMTTYVTQVSQAK